jgi:hypothetical protein
LLDRTARTLGDVTRDATHRWPPLELLVLPALVLVLAGVLTPTSELFPNQYDPYLYFQKAEAFAGGQLPYSQFAFEYPPLALLPMVLPYVAWPFGHPSFETYVWLFIAWEAIVLTALALVLSRIAARLAPEAPASVAARLVVLTLVATPSLAWRYDLFPAFLATLALLAVLEGWAATAGAALAVGVLAKLFPAVLVPVLALPWFLTGERARLTRFATVGVATFVVIVAITYGLVGAAIWDPITYQNERGLQVESLGGGLLLLRGMVTATPAHLTFDFGSVQVAGPVADRILRIQLPVLVTALVAVALLAVRRFRAEIADIGAVAPGSLVTATAATVAALLLTNKVFSVQYVVWLLPFAALLPSRQFWLFALICALSVGIHPLGYDLLIRELPPLIVLLNVRNALLVGLFVWLARSLGSATDRANQGDGDE